MKKSAMMVMAAWLICGLAGSPAWAADLGDAAPALKIGEWVKGKSVDLEKGRGENIYVVEFWATWCLPCVESIPHLTAVQKEYRDKGVVVVGISTEEPGKVKPFVQNAGEKMGYVVAIDDARKTDQAYMGAFGVGGIPHAFIIDKAGQIVWHGHPMDDMEAVLDKVIAGKWDLAAAKESDRQRRKATEAEKLLPEYFTMASTAEKNSKAMKKLGEKILERGGSQAQLMNGFAWTILTDNRIKFRDRELAMAAAEAAMKASDGKNFAIVDTYARALFDTGKVIEAIKYQKQAVELCQDPRFKADLEKTLKEYEEKTPEV